MKLCVPLFTPPGCWRMVQSCLEVLISRGCPQCKRRVTCIRQQHHFIKINIIRRHQVRERASTRSRCDRRGKENLAVLDSCKRAALLVQTKEKKSAEAIRERLETDHAPSSLGPSLSRPPIKHVPMADALDHCQHAGDVLRRGISTSAKDSQVTCGQRPGMPTPR
jgi:hypothetical protein